MVCPYCSHSTRVTNSRRRKPGFSTWRRRYCPKCQQAFSTIEQPVIETIIVLEAAGGQLRPLKQQNLYITIFKALGGLEGALDEAHYLTETCLNKALGLGLASLPEKKLRLIIFETLKAYRKTAAQRYLLEEFNLTESEFLKKLEGDENLGNKNIGN